MVNKDTIFFGSVVLVLLFAWLFVWPKVQEIETMRETHTQMLDDLEILRDTQNDVQQYTEFYSSLTEDEIELVNLAAPSGAEKPTLAVVLENIAQDSGVGLRSLNIEEGAGTQGALSIASVSMVVDGSYAAAKVFTGALEDTLRLFNITEVSISGSAESDLNSIDVSGRVFYSGN